MKLGLGLTFLAGMALAASLVVYQGAGAVLGMLSTLGWGLAPLILVHLLQLTFCALAWRPLIARGARRPLLTLLKIRWIREGTNGLLPLAYIGGQIIGARMLAFQGLSGDLAGASVVVDITSEVATQFLFTIAGVALLFRAGQSAGGMVDLTLGLVCAAALFGAFVVSQRVGVFRVIERGLERLAARARWLSLGGVKGLHEAIQAIHRDPLALAESGSWHLVAWVLGAVEVWLALHFMDVAISWRDAFILESLGQASRSVGFVVPGALGIQEGGYMLFGTMLGVPPEAGLALSLAKRVRELIFGLPAVAFWQFIEGRRLFGRRGAAERHAGE
ncbi:MAG: lysylphosphatidylglycerol synthase domain-containing protein [Alphaproteobacteria bacterium]